MTAGIIRMGDLSEEQAKVAAIVGLERYEALVNAYGGTWIYIPKTDAFERAARNERILEEFDGYNFRALALKYSLTEVQIRSIVSDKVREVCAKPLDGQISLFEKSV